MGVVSGSTIGRPLSSSPLAQVCFAKARPVEKLACLAVQHVIEGVALRGDQELALLSANGSFDQYRRLIAVPVVHVVRRELEPPLHFSGFRIEGKHRARIEIVAEPHRAVVVRSGISGSPEESVGVHVESPGHPGRRAAVVRRCFRLPRLAIGIAGLRRRVGSPQSSAGRGVIGIDEPGECAFAGRDANDDLAIDRQRRVGDRKAFLIVIHRDIPEHVSTLCVERHQVQCRASPYTAGLRGSQNHDSSSRCNGWQRRGAGECTSRADDRCGRPVRLRC